MNTEDRLRRASQEMDRVTAAITPPPAGELRRSALMRGVGVALASAVAVIVLVGGAVLLFNGRGSATLEPATPGETTTTTAATEVPQVPSDVDGVPVRVPEVDEEPQWPVSDDAVEVVYELPAELEIDLASVVDRLGGDLEGAPQEIVVLGESGGLRSYLLLGRFSGRDTEPALVTECFMSLGDTTFRLSCVEDGGIGSIVELDESGAGGTFGVVGSVAGASAAVLDIDGSKTWVRTREGTVNIVGRGSLDSVVSYVVYDAAGNSLDRGVVWDESRASGLDGSQTTTSAVLSPCSAGDLAPSALALSSIPQPVAQTLATIVAVARVCDFDALEALGVGGADIASRFGADDPSDLWTRQEENGEQPMYALMQILDMPYATIEDPFDAIEDPGLLYVWPSADVFEGAWDEMPEADKQTLLGLYSEQDLQIFADYGGYFGYRLGIRENGDWVFFLDPGFSEVVTRSMVSASSCSAGDLQGVGAGALALSSYSQQVAETLWEIVSAAWECDFERLAAIAGDDFNASFGGDDPLTLWTQDEDYGAQAMYALLMILDMPYDIVDLGDELMFVWPSAAAFDGTWDEMPEADKRPLLRLYTVEDLQDFADYGSYIGYRLGITESGDWSFFVAGD